MTPEEIVESLDANSRKLLADRGMSINPGILELLDKAGMRGFQLGSQTALSMVKGSLVVQLAKMDRSKEPGK